MKVLMVHKTHIGGVSRYVKEISRELKKRKIEVIEITRNEDLKIYSFLKSIKVLPKIVKRICEEKEIDVIHAHDWSITYPLLKFRNLVATFHGFPTSVLASLIENYCIKKLGKRAIVVSPRMKRRYKNATLITEGVNLKEFKPLKVKKTCCVGMCQSYNAKIVEESCKDLKCKFCLAKEVPFNKMVYFYNKLKVFISLPPKTAGFNLAWLEAMACNIPTIGTNDGIGEILPIYKIKKINKENVKRAIEEMMDKKVNYRKWIKKNRLTWEESAKKLIKMYETFISY